MQARECFADLAARLYLVKQTEQETELRSGDVGDFSGSELLRFVFVLTFQLS